MRNYINIYVLGLIVILVKSVYSQDSRHVGQWLVDRGNFTQMIKFLKRIGVFDTLNGNGDPFTLYAPPDEAFGNLPVSVLNKLSEPTYLKSVMLYHETSGIQLTLLSRGSVQARNGNLLTFQTLPNRTIMVQNAVIVKPDIILSNGVVQVIDRVLLPETIWDVLIKRDKQFSTLNILLSMTGLQAVMMGAGRMTVFAPTNDAFKSVTTHLPEFSEHGAISVYKHLLLNHIVNTTALLSKNLPNRLSTVSGKTLDVNIHSGAIRIKSTGSAVTGRITDKDLLASNGIIQVIDTVLIPADIKTV